jgi:hypothetical protein
MASTSGKRCTLSIEQKLEILEALKSKKPDDVAKDFNIGYSTVKKIRQNEEEIRKIALNNGNLNRWFASIWKRLLQNIVHIMISKT